MSEIRSILEWAVSLSFVVLGLAMTMEWLRNPGDRARMFLAASIDQLALVSIASRLATQFNWTQAGIGTVLFDAYLTVVLALFVGSAYAMTLFRHRLSRFHAVWLFLLSAIAAIGFLLPETVIVFLGGGAAPSNGILVAAATIALFFSWIICTASAVIWLGAVARNLPVVQRARVRALVGGYAGLIAILVVSAVGGSAIQSDAGQIATQLAALLLVPVLLAAFAPPRWLRWAWREREEQAFLSATHELLLFSPDEETLAERAVEWAIRLIGANAGFLHAKGRVLASVGMNPDDVASLRSRLATAHSTGAERVTLSTQSEQRVAIGVSLQTRFGRGLLVAVAGPFSPLFGIEEETRLRQYGAAVSTALDRVSYSRLIETLADVANLAMTSRSVTEVTATALRVVCEQQGWPVGHCLFPEGPFGEGRPLHLWHAPDSAEARAFIRETEANADAGYQLEAMRQSSAIYRDDLGAESDFVRHTTARELGITSGIWIPIASGEDSVGVIEFFSERPGALDASLTSILGGLGRNIGRMVEREDNLKAIEAARASAEAASEAKSEYLSRMSHELRTPLTSILGFTDLLQMRHHDPDEQESLDLVQKAARHLLDLINDVLDIARIEARRDDMALEAVPVRPAVAEALDLIRPSAHARDMSVSFDIEGDLGSVRADRQRLIQVLLNLLSNSVKYGGLGTEIRVAARTDHQMAVFEVTDHGPGISPALAKDLFEPFQRIGAERTTVEGTGLGLALCKRIIEGMEGSIGVESTLGKGSTFWFRLPLAEVASNTGDRSDGEGIEVPALKGASEQPAVLYVEDNLATVLVIEKIFALRPQARLITAMQGAIALELAAKHHPRLILLDLHLPDMDGEEVLRRLSSDPRTGDIPVIVLSADATARQRERLLAAGAHAYITKPVRVRAFLDFLDRIVLQKPPADEKPESAERDVRTSADV